MTGKKEISRIDPIDGPALFVRTGSSGRRPLVKGRNPLGFEDLRDSSIFLNAMFKGGKTFGGVDSAIPAILHGGEYVINKNSVDKYGLDILNRINKGIFNGVKQYKVGGYVSGIKTPEIPKYIPPMASYARISSPGISAMPSSSETTHNYNFYVDNFIGEQEWFNSMMKEYNVKVVPANQKQAGLESRVVRTYNGLNRGM